MAFRDELLARLPEIVIGTLAGRLGGPQAVGAFQGGMLQRQQVEDERAQQAAAAERQAQLDEERRQQQTLMNTRADESAKFQRFQSALSAFDRHVSGLGETAMDPTGAENQALARGAQLETAYGLPQGQLSSFMPSMTSIIAPRKAATIRRLAQAKLDSIRKMYGPEVDQKKAGFTDSALQELLGPDAPPNGLFSVQRFMELAEMQATAPTGEAVMPMRQSATPGSFEEYVGLSPEEQATRLRQRKEYMQADDRSPTLAQPTLQPTPQPAATSELARMVAGQPEMLQNLTPSVTGRILQEIASDQTLREQFEATRMTPIRSAAQRVRDRLNDLVDPKTSLLTPGARGIYGIGPGRVIRWVPGSREAVAKAALDQVTGNLTLNMLAEAKSQSRTGATGFGQLSNRELDVVESAATLLKGEISDDAALKELLTLRDAMDKILAPSSVERPANARRIQAGDTVRDKNGQRARVKGFTPEGKAILEPLR